MGDLAVVEHDDAVLNGWADNGVDGAAEEGDGSRLPGGFGGEVLCKSMSGCESGECCRSRCDRTAQCGDKHVTSVVRNEDTRRFGVWEIRRVLGQDCS